jgi:hypothetical protein
MVPSLPLWTSLLIILLGCTAAFLIGYKLGIERGKTIAKAARKKAIDMLFPPAQEGKYGKNN